MMVLVWLPRKKVMFFIEAGSPGGEVKSKEEGVPSEHSRGDRI